MPACKDASVVLVLRTPRAASKKGLTLLAAALLGFGAGAPAEAKPLALPADQQEKVNDAIDRGVRFLKMTQNKFGTWTLDPKSYLVGYAALPGLTLLECGVAADDPAVKKAAAFVRKNVSRTDNTYEIALSLLFLERLGDPKDEVVIQKLACRLIASQTNTGGWTYKCIGLSTRQQKLLLSVLQKLNPPPVDPNKAAPGPEARSPRLGGLGRSLCLKTLEGDPAGETLAKAAEPKPAAPPKKKKVPIPFEFRDLPVMHSPKNLVWVDPPNKGDQPILGTTDNSISQFAILALWAARRHGVPIDRTLRLVVLRYQNSQNPDGSWGYHFRAGGNETGSPAMTAVGLVGLAVGHGLADDPGKKAPDPRIVNGFVALSQFIGVPQGRMRDLPMNNLYMMWSIERVGMLYDLPTIGDKDWYRWGAELLVANQKGDGNWEKGGYWGSSNTLDTSLALLFLKRGNLAKDLTSKIPFQAQELDNQVVSKLPPKTDDKKTPPPDKAEAPPSVSSTPVPEDPSTTPPKPAVEIPSPSVAKSSAPSPPVPVKATEDGEGGSIVPLIIGIVLLVALLAGGGVWIYVSMNPQEEDRPRKHRKKTTLHGPHSEDKNGKAKDHHRKRGPVSS